MRGRSSSASTSLARTADVFVESRLGRDFEAEIRRVGLFVARDRQTVLDVDVAVAVLVLIREKDEVADAVVIHVAGQAKALALVTQGDVDAVRALVPQILIADLERHGADVRAVVVKLFERRRAVGVRVVDDERAAAPKRDVHADGAGESGKIAVAILGIVGAVAVVLDAAAELELDAFEAELFEREDGKRILFDLARDELFGAVDLVLAVKALETEAAGQLPVARLLEQRTVGKRLVVENGAGFLFAVENLQLFVPVIGVVEIVANAA